MGETIQQTGNEGQGNQIPDNNSPKALARKARILKIVGYDEDNKVQMRQTANQKDVDALLRARDEVDAEGETQ